MKTKLGTELHPDDQKRALATFVHRFIAEHRPQWARQSRPDGSAYAVPFASDADWLAHTRFAVRKDERLDQRAQHCKSSPTWPHDPELRKALAPSGDTGQPA